jgi:hypothetical protein
LRIVGQRSPALVGSQDQPSDDVAQLVAEQFDVDKRIQEVDAEKIET